MGIQVSVAFLGGLIVLPYMFLFRGFQLLVLRIVSGAISTLAVICRCGVFATAIAGGFRIIFLSHFYVFGRAFPSFRFLRNSLPVLFSFYGSGLSWRNRYWMRWLVAGPMFHISLLK